MNPQFFINTLFSFFLFLSAASASQTCPENFNMPTTFVCVENYGEEKIYFSSSDGDMEILPHQANSMNTAKSDNENVVLWTMRSFSFYIPLAVCVNTVMGFPGRNPEFKIERGCIHGSAHHL